MASGRTYYDQNSCHAPEKVHTYAYSSSKPSYTEECTTSTHW